MEFANEEDSTEFELQPELHPLSSVIVTLPVVQEASVVPQTWLQSCLLQGLLVYLHPEIK